jgi:hypothetical protein
MADEQARTGMVGLFWMVEDRGSAALIAHADPLAQAVPYGDMLTMEMGHAEHWAQLACRGTRSLRETGIPTAPVWSEYEEWPRGRVLYDGTGQRFVIRADRKLHRPEFIRLIADRFQIVLAAGVVLPDDHYLSVRRVTLPAALSSDEA